MITWHDTPAWRLSSRACRLAESTLAAQNITAFNANRDPNAAGFQCVVPDSLVDKNAPE
ncbi:MAG: hypothetical protein JO057_19535 [Chloroflexi bacterium]|nr:hypothetical protein [Chloroflexota bacterium]